MPRTLSSLADAQRILDGVNVVWLFDLTLDEFGLSTQTERWGSRIYSLSGNSYDDNFVPNGIRLGTVALDHRGGIASVGSYTLAVIDLEDLSAVADDFVLSGDSVVGYQVFSTGAEVTGDRFETIRGVIETHAAGRGAWTLTVKDDSKKLLKDIPVLTLDPNTYPNAYRLGRVFPFPFGNLNAGPDEGDGLSAVLAPCVITDKFEGPEASAGVRKATQGSVYQWYPNAERLALVVNTSTSGELVTVTDPTRRIITRPILAVSSNDVTDWQDAVDGDTTAGATLTSGDNLDVYFSGSVALGRMTAISVIVTTVGDTGDWTYTIRDDTSVKHGPTGVTGDQTISLTLTDWDAWELALGNILIDGPGSGSVVISDIKVQIDFDDFASFEEVAPQLWQKVTGYDDTATYYADGSVIVSNGQVLRNPVYQLEAILRDTELLGLDESQAVNGWTDAAASRSSWNFDWFLNERSEADFLGDFCFQAGLHLYPEEGGFSVAALDKARSPSHFFHGDYHMPAINGMDRDKSRWQYDFEKQPVDASQIINELHLRYRLHGPSGEYRAAKTASGQYRLTGTATLTSAGVFTDTSATFQTKNVVANERIYIAGDLDYKVVSVDSETVLTVAAVDGGTPSTITSAKTYYLGPNVDGTMVVSQLSYKTVNALGTRQQTFQDDGGFKSRFIVDDATATLLIEHVKEWFASPRDIITFPLFHNAVNVTVGDIFMLEHPKLQISKRPAAITTLSTGYSSTDTVITPAAGTAGIFQDNDYVMYANPNTFEPEIMQVSSVDVGANTFTVTRGQLNTTAMALTSGETIYRSTTKWMITSLRPMTPQDPVVRVRAVQMPPDYKKVGRVVEAGYANYSAATNLERLLSGWATLRNERVQDLDPDSNISYVGADSGTYTIL